jgi:hypothetical protein
MTVTAEMIPAIVAEAQQAASDAANAFYNTKLGGQDRYACGFAWVSVYGVKGSTKVGKALLQNGFRKSYEGGLQMWNPSNHMCQNVDTKEEGARAAAQVFKKYGIEAYAGSRLD